jgi:DNA repair protein RadC
VTVALALEGALRLQPDPTRRFLSAALSCPAPSPAELVAAGVPHYEAALYCRRLESAGELRGDGWTDAARRGYQALLASLAAEAETVAPAGAPRPSRRLAQLREEDRPREKALRSGIKALSDGELLALLLRTGAGDEGVMELADRLLAEHDGLVGLARCGLDALAGTRGLGPAKTAEIAAAFELAVRIAQAGRRRDRPRLRAPEEVAAYLAAELVMLRHEEFWCLPLDARGCLIGEPRVASKGDVDGTEAGPRAFFRLALAAGAVSCIAVHNHPTGDPSPSGPDRAVTVRLVQAGRTLDLPLHDHLIMGDGGRFVSLRRVCPECFR